MTALMPDTQLLDRFQSDRRRLLALFDRVGDAARPFGMNEIQCQIGTLRERLNNDAFKVLVLGAFKRGKSTFINAMLGAEVLPNYATPCTAVINEVKYADEKRVWIHFKNPLPDELPAALAEKAREHIEAHRAKGPVPPLEAPVDELEEYVVINDPGMDQAEAVFESPFDHAELYWPLALCKNGVEIIDSPGLDEHASRTKVTEGYLGQADAVLFVMSCSALAGRTEMEFIENNLRANGFEDILFVCNRFDEIRDKERDRVIKFARDKLGAQTNLGDNGVFFVSAAKALDSRIDNTPDKLDASGVPAFERRLFEFLTASRGKAKLLQPARQLAATIKRVDADLSAKRAMLHQKAEDVEARVKEARERAHAEEANIQRFRQRQENARKDLGMEIERRMKDALLRLSDELPDAIKSFEPKTEIKLGGMVAGVFNKTKLQNQIKPLATEVAEAVGREVERRMGAWQRADLQPYLEQWMKSQEEAQSHDIDRILDALDGIREDLAHTSSAGADGAVKEQEVSGTERLLAGVGGFLLTGVGGAMTGGLFGYKEMLKNLIPYIGILVVSLIIGLTNPFVLIGLLFGGGFVQGLLKLDSIKKRVRDKMAEETARKIREESSDLARVAAAKVTDKMAEIAEAMEGALRAEIQSVLDFAKAALDDQRRDAQERAREEAAIVQAETDLKAVQSELTEMVMDLAQS